MHIYISVGKKISTHSILAFLSPYILFYSTWGPIQFTIMTNPLHLFNSGMSTPKRAIASLILNNIGQGLWKLRLLIAL